MSVCRTLHNLLIVTCRSRRVFHDIKTWFYVSFRCVVSASLCFSLCFSHSLCVFPLSVFPSFRTLDFTVPRESRVLIVACRRVFHDKGWLVSCLSELCVCVWLSKVCCRNMTGRRGGWGSRGGGGSYSYNPP